MAELRLGILLSIEVFFNDPNIKIISLNNRHKPFFFSYLGNYNFQFLIKSLQFRLVHFIRIQELVNLILNQMVDSELLHSINIKLVSELVNE